MMKQTVTVKNKIGIHSRPAAMIVDASGKYKSEITISNGEKTVAANSMTKLLALRIKQGMEIVVSAQGDDEAEALADIVSIVETGFGEAI